MTNLPAPSTSSGSYVESLGINASVSDKPQKLLIARGKRMSSTAKDANFFLSICCRVGQVNTAAKAEHRQHEK